MRHLIAISLVLTLAVPVAAQVSQTAQINNTGCPGASYLTASSTQINTATTLTLPSHGATAFSWVRFTYHAGFTSPFPQPLACAPGCRLYGDGSVELAFVALPQGVTSATFQIPNSLYLVFSLGTIALQSVAWVPGTTCVTLDGAISFVFAR